MVGTPKVFVGLLLLLHVGLYRSISTTAFGADVFEQIGQQKDAVVSGIAANPVPKLPDIALPWDEHPRAGFQPAEKITTQAQLDAELGRMREKYAPFMVDLARALPVTRRRMELKKFDWRLATENDLADMGGAVNGKGNWEQVSIPHYRGPINHAVAFYRTELEFDSSWLSAETLFLHFQAVDYLADIYVNGQHVGAHEGLFGAFEFEIKPFVKPGANVLLVRVQNDAVMMGDFMNPGKGRQFGKKIAACGGPGWDDPQEGWHMCPPGFGIWQSCWLETRPTTQIRDIFVRPLPQKNEAEVEVELAGDTQGVSLSYSLYGQNFQSVLAEHKPTDGISTFTVSVPPAQLRWWSPDEPWLYQIQIELKRNGKLVDVGNHQFGMRTLVQSAASTPKGRFYLNGKEIRLRGANMMGNLMQCVMRHNFDQLRDDILLAKIAHMNFWRMTQQPCPQEVYDYFDRLGLLAQTDLPTFCGIRKDQADAAFLQLQEAVRLVRGHPCDAIISYLNEPDFNKPMMLDRKGHEALFGRFDEAAAALNPDQLTKWVDGDYVNLSPTYSDDHDYSIWYGSGIKSIYEGGWHGTRQGWMCGCGEFGSEGLDSVALMNKYYPKAWIEKAADASWTPALIPKCQTSNMGPKWYSKPNTMEEWVQRSQENQMWGVRLMTESLRRNPKINSFAVHLLIDAWPAGWLKSLMDCDRQAKPAYFAYRDALTPLAVNLQPDQFYSFSGDNLRVRAWVCNDTQEALTGSVLRYQLELDGKIIQSGNASADVKTCEPQFQGDLTFAAPDVASRQIATLRLGLFDGAGKLLHDTAADLEIFPMSKKGQKLDRPGGQAQRLIK